MEIRNATMDDLQAIAAVEAACFPAAEAATAEEFAGRLAHYAGHFWLLLEQGELVAFVDGFCTDMPDLTDEMYADAALHDENGAWQMIFGVNTLPALPLPRLRRAAAAAGHCRCPRTGAQGAGADLQGKAFALLRKVRLCERGRFRLYPRRGGVVSDAAAVLRYAITSYYSNAGASADAPALHFHGRRCCGRFCKGGLRDFPSAKTFVTEAFTQ